MARLHANNYVSTLSSSILDSDTTMDVVSTTHFPSIGGDDTCNITISDGSVVEIVTATDITANTITIIRGQEGTAALAWSSGDSVSIRPTADSFDRKLDKDNFTDALILMSDNTTNDSSMFQHGFLKKLNSDAAYYMDGTGNWSVPAGGGGGGGISDGNKGDITVASSGTAWTINTPSSVTIASNDKLLLKDTSASDTMGYVTLSALTAAMNISGTNTGDQTSIVGITGTKAQFDTAVTDGNFLYIGDVTQYTDEMAQDAVGNMVDGTLVYNDGSPYLQRAALTGDVTASAGSNATTIANSVVTYAKMQDVSATDKILGRSSGGSGVVQEIDCTAAGRALLDDANASAQRTTLGLGTLATQSGTFSGTSSGTNTGDQTINLTGDVTGSGTGSFATTIVTPSSVTAANNDKVLIKDTSATDAFAYVTTQSIRDLAPGAGTLTSAQLAAALTNEAGTGSAAFNEDGTFTPGIAFGGLTTGITYTTQAGQYTRVGNMVYFQLAVILSSKGSATGQATVTGLPFTARAGGTFCIGTWYPWNVTYTSNPLIYYVQGGTSFCGLQFATSASTPTDLTNTQFTNASRVYISGCILI